MFLAVDLGATKTLFALAERRGADLALTFERRYEDRDFACFDDMAARFVAEAGAATGGCAIESACIGAAGPVAAGRVALTNLDWTLDAAALSRRFGWPRVQLVNDFAAAASGVAALGPDDVVTLQAAAGEPRGPRVVIGAGTGLGVAYAVSEGEGWRVIAGEGGHRGFAPQTERQAALADHWRRALGRVSDETLVSGAGIERIYAFERARATHAAGALDDALAQGAGPEAVTEAAERGDLVAAAAVDLFVECYGQVAGDHALGVMATGGVYVAGGIAPRLLPRLQSGAFLRGFRAKGEQSEWMARFPVHVVTHPAPGLLGAAVIAAG
jgi:glucokinase